MNPVIETPMKPVVLVDYDKGMEQLYVWCKCGWEKWYMTPAQLVSTLTEDAAAHMLEHERGAI